jgi:hypothetical protein
MFGLLVAGAAVLASEAMDVITPAGVSQADELAPTLGAVSIHPVVIP